MLKISDEIDIHDLKSVLLKSLWAIDFLNNFKKDRFSASEISKFLIEEKRINISRQAIQYCLTKNINLCNHNKFGFKIMKPGQDKLLELIDKNKVILIESGRPFTAKNISLKEVFCNSKGIIRICDPYVDTSTLDVIFNNINKNNVVHLLTSKINNKPFGVINRYLDDLKKEGYTLEVKIYNNSELHDRYFLDEKSFWLSGNSFNYLGNKESFIVKLEEDIRLMMLSTFNHRWKIAMPL